MTNKKDKKYNYKCSKCKNESIIYDYGLKKAVCKLCKTPIENFKKNMVSEE
jgi:ribosomal protein S27E